MGKQVIRHSGEGRNPGEFSGWDRFRSMILSTVTTGINYSHTGILFFLQPV